MKFKKILSFFCMCINRNKHKISLLRCQKCSEKYVGVKNWKFCYNCYLFMNEGENEKNILDIEGI